MSAAVLVPIKAFADAKVRLSSALSGPDRDALARRLAARVLAAAAPLPLYVACDDGDVAAFATVHGAEVLWTPGLGLNGAVVGRVVVAHADLPRVRGLAELAEGTEDVVLAPDRKDDGTNVLALPAVVGFRFSYGPGSFARHRAEADRLGLTARVVRDDRFAWDVDLPADLDGLECG
jgi:2-phospho-L-lactate guanylyltransferase